MRQKQKVELEVDCPRVDGDPWFVVVDARTRRMFDGKAFMSEAEAREYVRAYDDSS